MSEIYEVNLTKYAVGYVEADSGREATDIAWEIEGDWDWDSEGESSPCTWIPHRQWIETFEDGPWQYEKLVNLQAWIEATAIPTPDPNQGVFFHDA